MGLFKRTKECCFLLFFDVCVILVICSFFTVVPLIAEIGLIYFGLGASAGFVLGQYWENYWYTDLSRCCDCKKDYKENDDQLDSKIKDEATKLWEKNEKKEILPDNPDKNVKKDNMYY